MAAQASTNTGRPDVALMEPSVKAIVLAVALIAAGVPLKRETILESHGES